MPLIRLTPPPPPLSIVGLYSARTVPGAEEGRGTVQGVDEGDLQRQLEAGRRLLPMPKRLVRGVPVGYHPPSLFVSPAEDDAGFLTSRN